MRIGVDIDGVLNYRNLFLVECGTKFCVETGKGRLMNLGSPWQAEMFGWDEEARQRFWHEYGHNQVWTWPAQNYAAEVIRKLREEGHEIIIVTGRSNDDEKVLNVPNVSWEELTKQWLAKNEIEYDGFGFGLVDKGAYCEENQIDLMIEDLPMFLDGFEGKETRVMVFDAPYNRQIDLENAVRVYAWYDIYDKIKEMEG